MYSIPYAPPVTRAIFCSHWRTVPAQHALADHNRLAVTCLCHQFPQQRNDAPVVISGYGEGVVRRYTGGRRSISYCTAAFACADSWSMFAAMAFFASGMEATSPLMSMLLFAAVVLAALTAPSTASTAAALASPLPCSIPTATPSARGAPTSSRVLFDGELTSAARFAAGNRSIDYGSGGICHLF